MGLNLDNIIGRLLSFQHLDSAGWSTRFLFQKPLCFLTRELFLAQCSKALILRGLSPPQDSLWPLIPEIRPRSVLI